MYQTIETEYLYNNLSFSNLLMIQEQIEKVPFLFLFQNNLLSALHAAIELFTNGDVALKIFIEFTLYLL